MIINVSDSAGLTSALASVHDGDTISLAAGEYVMANKIQNLTYAQGITITSADPSHKAIIDGIYLQDASGVTLNNLEIKVDPRQQVGVIVQGGGNVTLENLDIHGAGVGDGLGIRLGTVSNVTIANNEIHGTDGGVTVSSSTGVSILNNRIHDIESDGIQSLGTSNETLSGNYFTNFYPAAGDHSDAMQFVGLGGQVHDITITNNTYFRGVGDADTQGVFMGDEAGLATNYENVTVTGNTIIGGVYHGITVSAADHLTLSHNVVEGYTDQGSWILITGSSNASETDNQATNFNPGSGNTNLTTSGNETIASGSVGDASYFHAHDLSINAGVGATLGGSTSSGSLGTGMSSSTSTNVSTSTTTSTSTGASTATSTASGGSSGSSTQLATQADPHVIQGTSASEHLNATATATEIHGGAGADTISGVNASEYLRGDDGDDSISGGAGFDDMNGNAGNDTLHGNGGDDWTVGGQGNDYLYGDAGNDIVWGNLGNDTCDGGDGADQIRGGQGDDVLFGGAGNDFLSGDRGNDTITGGAGADIFHGSQDAGIDKVMDFNQAEGDHVLLDAGTHYTVSQVGADTVIDMGGGNEMILANVQLSSLHTGWLTVG